MDGFTNPFRYIPDSLVMRAGQIVIDRLNEWSALPDGTHLREIERSFAEGKMLGVLVCATASSDNSTGNSEIGFIAGFSGSVRGGDGLATCTVEGFVPPIIDLTCPDGYFKIEEAEISRLNKELDSLTSSDEFSQLKLELKRAEAERDAELEGLVNTYGKEITDDYIQRIDDYMYYNNKQYPSHYKTIIRWIEKDKKDGAYHKPAKPSTFNNFEQREETDYDRQVREMMKAQRGDKK